MYDEGQLELRAAARLGAFPVDIQEQLLGEKEFLTNDIILQIPARTKPENIMKKFHDIIESMTSPQSKDKPSFEYRIKHTNRSFQVTVKGKHEGYEPMVVLVPKNKAKGFAKRYDEYILKEDVPKTE